MEKEKIVNGRLMVSTDDGKTWKDSGPASAEDIAAYNDFIKSAKKQTSGKKADTKLASDLAPYSMEEAYTPKGVALLNSYAQAYNLPTLPSNASRDQIKAKASELQSVAIQKNPDLVVDYMTQRNPKPNNKLNDILGPKGYGKKVNGRWEATNEDLKKAISEGKITNDELRNAYKDDQWWFRALSTNKKRLPRAQYEEQMRKPGAIKQGDKTFFNDPKQPWLYTEYEPYDPENKVQTEEAPLPLPDQPHLGVLPQEDYAPWWLQDVIKTAHAAGNFGRVKKYPPWQAVPAFALPEPTFYDPTRELAANAEMANIGTQGLSTFTNPQAFAAGFSAIQGNAARNAADILGRYNNLNVGVANQFETTRKGIMNDAASNRANLATNLFDKYTIMNQQFDNAKGIRRDQLVDQYTNAITNKNYTANLNDLTDQYKINPATGGRKFFTHGRPLDKNIQDTDAMASLSSMAQKLIDQGVSQDKAFDIALRMSSGAGTGGYDPSMGYPG